MGKESKLRNIKDNGTRYEYTNGQRKLNDRDKPPPGTDEDVWDLALYFEQVSEENEANPNSRPVIYTELYHRIGKDPDLCHLLPSDDPSLTTRARTDGMYGTHDKIVFFIRKMIDTYFDTYYRSSDLRNIPVNDFTSKIVFDYIKKYVSDTIKREELITNGIRVPISQIDIKPSRRTEKEKIAAEIDAKTYTEQEYKDKVERWKRDHNHTPEE